ncbi:Peptidase M16 domain-containing protein [Rozella allomycis CSF55]|uniref:Presequence protease, mitochondrial n=1 Tax=Rozella allomycis (strain CSF55) TaxID=988480 RepID=A0A075AR14_ROZAC|nr:Peptidase M16 domain-containing protein [Rozella allomycis CSF55]|eukprot:EPZ32580.1 Peptidase M16 domain-containing protein [Rozella allomycis CSF55]
MPLLKQFISPCRRTFRKFATASSPDNICKHPNFVLKASQRYNEYKMTAYLYEHIKTKASYMHLEKSDTNKLFAVGFKTLPADNKGIPHILEHLTLCGSEKYPVRDPFFRMLRRSLSNYMNAWTFPYFTMYPFTTENESDYNNLMRIYVDAVFRPLLKREDFMQEGWRLEQRDLGDVDSEVEFKGVVFNEMKGALSDSNSVFENEWQKAMFEGSKFGVNSGGDPSEILRLGYEELVRFRNENYHPTNAYFVSYGDVNVLNVMEYLDSQIKEFEEKEKIDESGIDGFEIKGNETVYIDCPVDPIGEEEKQVKMVLSFYTNPVKDLYESFVMRLLSCLLLNGPASPMYKSLIETNLGNEYSPINGYDCNTPISTFSFGLQGISEGDVEKVKEIIFETLEKSMYEGFPMERIEAALHQIELSLKHKTSKFGIGIAQSLMMKWMHGINPLESLNLEQILNKLREELKDPNMFKSRIFKYFFKDPKFKIIISKPNKNYQKDLDEKESKILNELIKKNDKNKILKEALKVKQRQEENEDENILPCLEINEISKKGKDYSVLTKSINSTKLFLRETETNGINYFNAIIPFQNLSKSDLSFIPILSFMLSDLGVTTKSKAQFQQDIEQHTGGISFSPFLSPNLNDSNKANLGLSISSYALANNTNKMFNLISEALKSTNFNDIDHIKTLINSNASNAMSSISSQGHSYAMQFAASKLTKPQAIDELWTGLYYVRFLDMLKSKSIKEISETLHFLSSSLIALKDMRMFLVTQDKESVEFSINNFVSGFGSTSFKDSESFEHTAQSGSHSFIPLPFGCSFASLAIKAVPYLHKDAMALSVLAKLLTNKFLHKEIREKNGAYGGGASYSSLNGIFSFYSYRDPNPLKSIEIFKSTEEFVKSKPFDPKDLHEAKLGLFSAMDSPVDVQSEGVLLFEHGITDEMRQERRNRLFEITLEDVYRVAGNVLGSSDSSAVVLGKDDQDSKREFRDWEVTEFRDLIDQ